MKAKKVSAYALCTDRELDTSNFHKIKWGKKRPSDEMIRTIAEYLEVPEAQLFAWRIIDEYSPEVLDLVEKERLS